MGTITSHSYIFLDYTAGKSATTQKKHHPLQRNGARQSVCGFFPGKMPLPLAYYPLFPERPDEKKCF
jgi:hypothetical protein